MKDTARKSYLVNGVLSPSRQTPRVKATPAVLRLLSFFGLVKK